MDVCNFPADVSYILVCTLLSIVLIFLEKKFRHVCSLVLVLWLMLCLFPISCEIFDCIISHRLMAMCPY